MVVSIGRRLNLSTAIFVFSIPLALWKPEIIYFFWVGLFILLFTTDWLSWQLASMKEQTSFPLDGAKRASIHVQHEAGLLKIDSEAEGSTLLNGVFGGGLVSDVDRSKYGMNIRLRVLQRQGLLSWKFPWSWGPENVRDWTLHLSDQIPLALALETSSGLATLELGSLQITELKISANSSATQITLPDRTGTTTVNIEARTASLTIHVPSHTAATIHHEIVGGKIEVDLARFPMIEDGREYRSGNYKTARKHVDIRLHGTMSSVEIV